MITASYVRMMARYNAWRNEHVIQEAASLSRAELKLDRGAFFGSIFGTLNHLLWGDMMWMSRFDGGDGPPVAAADNTKMCKTLKAWAIERRATDARISDWSRSLKEIDLKGPLTWHSGVLGRDMVKPMGLCVMGFFNHQTHHRGQVHAMMTAAGVKTADTDLFIMPDEV